MDRSQYPNLIHTILHNLAEWYIDPAQPEVETELLLDDARGNYALLDIGWTDDERVMRHYVYVRLKNGKFWIEEDWTEDGIVTHLEKAGVPNNDIVLAINPPEVRELTGFAVA